MSFSAFLLPPGTRPSADDFTGLAHPDTVWQDARWWRYTERTDLHQTRYLEVHEDGQVVALAPLLVTPRPGGLLFYDAPRLAGAVGPMAEPELLDPSERQRWADLTATLPDPDQYPSMTLGTFGNHHGVAHAADRTHSQRAAVMTALPDLLVQAADEMGCRSVAMLYIGETEAADVDRSASAVGYAAALLGAEGVLDLADTTWEGYLAGLSKRRRYQARKELRNYAAAGYRTVIRTGPDAITDDLVALQVTHRAKYGLPGGDERVRRDLAAIRDDLGESAVVLSAERDRRKRGFVLYLRTRDALFARTGGTDPDALGTYFALDYHETARWALEHGIRRIHYGMAAYEAKVTRGCALHPRWGWFRFTGPRAAGYREVLALQSDTMARQLALAGTDVKPVPSQLTSKTGAAS